MPYRSDLLAPEFVRALATTPLSAATGEILSAGRKVRAVIATDRPGRDGLTLDVAQAKFRRKSLPLLVGHDVRSLPVGHVTDIHAEKRNGYTALVGTLEFGHSTRAQEIAADVRSGLVNEVSIGFDVPKGNRDWRTGRAVPLITEVSLVPVAMDDESVIFERSYGSTVAYERALFPLEVESDMDDYADVSTPELRRALVDLLVRMGIGVNIRGEEIGWTRDYDAAGPKVAVVLTGDESGLEEALCHLLGGLDDDDVDYLGGLAEDVQDENDPNEQEPDYDEDDAGMRSYGPSYTRSRFSRLAAELEARGATDGDALAAHIGRKKYGRAGMAALAAAGRAKKKAMQAARAYVDVETLDYGSQWQRAARMGSDPDDDGDDDGSDDDLDAEEDDLDDLDDSDEADDETDESDDADDADDDGDNDDGSDDDLDAEEDDAEEGEEDVMPMNGRRSWSPDLLDEGDAQAVLAALAF